MDSFFDAHLPEPQQRASFPPAPPARPLTAADVRAMMVEMIEILRDGGVSPEEEDAFARKKAMFPIMAQWLDPADGATLLAQFNRYDRPQAK